MHHPTDKLGYITAFGTPVVEHWLERKISRWLWSSIGLYATMVINWIICYYGHQLDYMLLW